MARFKPRRIASMLFACTLLAAITLGVSATISAESAKTWKVGVDPTYAPFAYINPDVDGIDGFDIVLAKTIGKQAGHKIEFVPLPFDGLIPALQSRNIDFAMSAMTITLPRSRAVDFSRPYFQAGQALIVSSDPSAPQSKEDLKGKSIAAVIGSLGSDVAKKQFPDSDLTHYSSTPLVLKAVADRIDAAAIEGGPSVKYAIDHGGLKGLRILDMSLTQDYYGAAFPTKSKSLPVFNAALGEIIESGEYKRLFKTWFGSTPPQLPEIAPVLEGQSGFLAGFDLKGTLTGLTEGLSVTILLTFIAAFLGLIGSAILVWLGRSPIGLIQAGCRIYIELFRGTPMLVQLFVLYFGVPGLLSELGIPLVIDKWTASIATLSLNAAAYGSEILRGAIDSIDRGQQEAADSLGFSPAQGMRWIIAPQALTIALPGLGNQFITLIKDTSLVAVIGLDELFRDGQLIVASTYRAFEVYILVALVYLVLTSGASFIFKRLEKRQAVASTR
ncbi:MAG: ABC transporter substrate-binding protein/permease [Luteolibacter sp.]